jgi:hypothetical protein
MHQAWTVVVIANDNPLELYPLC